MVRKLPDFDELQKLKQFLAELRDKHAATLEHYLSPDERGFYHQPSKPFGASRSSSATCITSLVRANLWEKGPWRAATAKIAEHLIRTPWKSAGLNPDNPFTVSFIVEGIQYLGKAVPKYDGHQQHQGLIQKAAIPLLKNQISEGFISIKPYPASAYLTQLTYRVLNESQEAGCNVIDDRLRSRIHKWARAEINRQIALISAGGPVSDPLNLAYALILSKHTLSDEHTSTEEQQVSAHALDLFFAGQKGDGTWPQSQPLFHYPEVGSAYCFEYELLAQLLLSRHLRANLLFFIPQMAKAAYRLATSGLDLKAEQPATIVGWPSGHHPQTGGPESWSTACVYDFAFQLDRLVAEAIRQVLFQELGAAYLPPTNRRTKDLDGRLLDAELFVSESTPTSLRQTLEQTLVKPVSERSDLVANGGQLTDTAISVVLFGPLGTSKTSLAELISNCVGWPLLQVDPSYLLQDGMDKIQARANRLFSMFAEAEQVVVLLDEFDEMGRARRMPHQDLLSRFITTAMLPKLATINKRKKIVFLMATNFIDGFDAAFIRPGRFDMLIQVLQPSFQAKVKHWPKLQRVIDALSEEDKEQAKQSIEQAQQSITDLTFDECMRLVEGLDEGQPAECLTKMLAAQSRGTLNQPREAETDTGADKSDVRENKDTAGPEGRVPKPPPITWKKACENERRFIRVYR